jgi:hypothetical protein
LKIREIPYCMLNPTAPREITAADTMDEPIARRTRSITPF